MLHYIRYLKVPFLCTDKRNCPNVKALITITTDLGDAFLAEDVNLNAVLFVNNDEDYGLHRNDACWKRGVRTLWIEVPLPSFEDPERHWRLVVTARHQTLRLQADSLSSDVMCEIVSAWSNSIRQGAKANVLDGVERRLELKKGNVLSIREDSGESIARHIWDAGIALASFLADGVQHTQGPNNSPIIGLLRDRSRSSICNVLELGSGCGIVGIALAQLFPDLNVFLTDTREAMEILKLNISQSKPAENVTLNQSILDWTNPLPEVVRKTTFDLLLVSDCTYNADSVPALVDVLSKVASHSPDVIIIVSLKLRHPSEEIFFELMALARFVETSHTALCCLSGATAAHEHPGIIHIYRYKLQQ